MSFCHPSQPLQRACCDCCSLLSCSTSQLHLVSCFSEAFGTPGVSSRQIDPDPELAFRDMRYISPVNRCGTTHLGGWACSLLVVHACLLLFLVHFQGIAMMRTLKEGICQCIKYVERHLRVMCYYTEKEKHISRVLVQRTFFNSTFFFLSLQCGRMFLLLFLRQLI